MQISRADLAAKEVVEDPYTYFNRLREEDPVHWNEDHEIWMLTRYEDLMKVFRTPETYANDRAGFYQGYLPEGKDDEFKLVFHLYERWLGGNDNPRHDHMRRVVNAHWTPTKVEELRPLIRKTVDDLLDKWKGKRHVDLLADFASPLPSVVISAVIGIPYEDWWKVKGWSDDWAQLHFSPQKDVKLWEKSVEALRQFHAYSTYLVRERKASYVDRMLNTDFDGDRLTEDELIVHITEQLFAGHETTAHAITNGVHLFMRHRDQWDRLRGNPALARTAFEEVLRYEGPVKMITRLAKKDSELRGKKIKKGDRIMLVLAAANRDPRHIPDPEKFDIGRSPNPHVTFGHATHFCLGAPLARLESEEAFVALAQRFPKLAPTQESVKVNTSIRARALEALPLALA